MDEVAAAIAHPTRRSILVLLGAGPLTAGAIADRFADSRPAISRHLRVLREAELVSAASDGREIHYSRCLSALAPLEGWLAELRSSARWERRFDALETEVQRVRRFKRRGTHRRTATQKQTKESA